MMRVTTLVPEETILYTLDDDERAATRASTLLACRLEAYECCCEAFYQTTR